MYLKAMDLISRFAILCIGGNWRGTLTRSRSSTRPLTLAGQLNTEAGEPEFSSPLHVHYNLLQFNCDEKAWPLV